MKKIYLSLLLLPFPALAETTLGSLISAVNRKVLDPLIGLLLTLAIVVFFWGMVKYIRSLGEKEKKEGKDLMVWGIIALFVMVSVWGIVRLIANTIGLDNKTAPSPIVLPGTQSPRDNPNNTGDWALYP
jgi:TRAP-type C4-dicarboxylate transport system permease small subunit